ncbi:carbohydrate-binding family 9-like protein [Flavobacteriaceae bacterium F89]|uniref:Carbohydrate-binding family 9-like protein n=1 Tax=Cerina litoralis TaxID=2874477 RepID=A0AAE3EWX2_9FLAO|nr:carbohydrate-binding family 9-like protein [Cerina litoralis]MCG2461839.1 carbohydrate-binding family 9-like protein [Cerina litoralis]
MNKLFFHVPLITLATFGIAYLLTWGSLGNLGKGFGNIEYVPRSMDTIKYSPCAQFEIPNYQAYKISNAPKIDGRLDELEWQLAPRSPSFRDLISGSGTIHDTHAAVLWDDEFLYVAYWVEEPNLQASITERDGLIYQDNDVELFIAGQDAYYEFEINAYGTIYEVFFIWEEAYITGGYDTMTDFGIDEPGRRIFNGVGYKPHPRGLRIGFWNWDLKGLRSAVFADGTINDDRDRDRGWTVELALPWSSISVLAKGDNRSIPPRHKDIWRMDFSRFNQYKEAKPAKDSGGWAWSPHGVWDSHMPECFTFVKFSEEDIMNFKK